MMGAIPMFLSRSTARKISWRRETPAFRVCSLTLLFCFTCACTKLRPIDTTPLDNVGMTYSSIRDLKALHVTDAEVAQLAEIKQGGVSDSTCVELLRIYRSRNQAISFGDAVLGLVQAGMSEDSILELARLNQLGLGVGELQAIRLAGLPDSIVLDIARRHTEGKPVLSGPSIAQLMNTGMSRQTIHELVRRGVPDTQAQNIINLKRRRTTDAEILRRYSGSSTQ